MVGGLARLLRASRHDMGCLEVSGGLAQLRRASRHDMGCLEVLGRSTLWPRNQRITLVAVRTALCARSAVCTHAQRRTCTV